MFLISEPAWRYLLFMGFICLYSLYRVVSSLYGYHRQKWQRINKAAERVMQQRRQEGSLLDAPLKITLSRMSFHKRSKLVLEVVSGSIVFLLGAGWSVRLLQTATHTHKGIVAASERDDYSAMKEYQWALKSNPVAGKIYYAFSAMQSEADRQVGELSGAQLLVRLNPQDPEAYNKLGSVYIKFKRYNDAIKAFRNGLMLLPNSGPLHNNLGSALSADLQIEAAADEFQRAIHTDPFNGTYHNNLGDVYAYKHDLGHAEEEYRVALQNSPALIRPYWRLSEMLEREGKHQEAKAILRNLLDKSHMPEDAAVIDQTRAAIAAIEKSGGSL
jgi:tetratricopeptide (TPR) repeat protein